MIRINLLGTAKPRKGKSARKLFVMPKLTAELPSPMIAGLAVAVVCGALLYLDYIHLQAEHAKLHDQIIEADRSIASMTGIKRAYTERQKEYDAFKRRFDVIDQLRAGQQGPVPLLASISETVNQSDGVWLLNMKDDGAKVSLEGVALGPNQLAALMNNLRKSGFFKDVELKDTFEDEKGGLPTFSFTLDCTKTKA